MSHDYLTSDAINPFAISPVLAKDDDDKDEKDDKEKSSNMMERMLKARTILIYGRIDQKMAKQVTEQILMLEADNDEDPIKIFINSEGGHVDSGFTIFDMIRYVKSPVKLIGTGWAASAGALIYAAVDVENRYSLPHTRYMIHQPLGGASGQASDIAIAAEEIMKIRKSLNEILAEQTGKPLEQLELDTDRNFWMTAAEAKEYGLVGTIINNASEIV